MWFTETAWPPIFICIAGMLIFVAAWLQNARKLYFFSIIGLGALCFLLYGVECWIVTEPEQVEQRVLDLARAVEEDDADKVLAFISDEGLKNHIRAAMQRVRIEDGIRITDLSAHYNDEKTAVISRFRANGMGVVKGNAAASRHLATMWELSWKREGDQWQIDKIQRLDPISEKPVGLLSGKEEQ